MSSKTTPPLPRIQLTGKPQYQKLAEDFDFFQLFKKIERQYENCFLLESLGEESTISRYHIIGFDPEEIIYAQDGKTLCIENTKELTIQSYTVENPYYALREVVPQNVISRRYAGGLVGYIGYDSINFFEPTLDIKTSDEFEPFKFGIYKDGIIYDKMTGEVLYFHYDLDRFSEVESLLQKPDVVPQSISVKFLHDTMDREQHAAAVERVKQNILDGLIFQCEVGFKSRYRIEGDTICIYEKLREVNPSPHMYFVKFGQQQIIGASPELLFRLRQGEMETFPLAGTINRGKSPEEDVQLARKLLNDPKEIAEHNMLVDLHRNDIGRVARFGTVKVRSLMDIKRYSHVQHISSEIVGIIDEKEDMFSALASNFPAGTLSGAPKIEAIKIIDELESEARGPYGGALGQFSFNGDCIFSIPIRTLFINGKQGYAQTCGGNVYDSVAENEYLEIQRKLAAMKKTLSSFEGGDAS